MRRVLVIACVLASTACAYHAPTAPTSTPTLPAPSSITILCFGSSITAGYAGSYVGLLQANLAGRAIVENRGVNGDGLVYGEPKIYAGVAADHPELIVVEYAVNDAISAPTLETFEMMYRRMITKVQSEGVTRVVLLTTNPAKGRPSLEAYNDLYRRLARELPGVSVIDTYPRWASLTSADFARYVPDGVHPTTEGWEQTAGAAVTTGISTAMQGVVF